MHLPDLIRNQGRGKICKSRGGGRGVLKGQFLRGKQSFLKPILLIFGGDFGVISWILFKAILKLRLSEKHSKFFRNLPHALYIYLVHVQTMRKFFQILCASQNVRTLTQRNLDRSNFDLVLFLPKIG